MKIENRLIRLDVKAASVLEKAQELCNEVEWIMKEWRKANTPDPETKLKPCPFCAGKVDLGLNADGLYYVFCDWCGLEAPGQYIQDQAIDYWNQRYGQN